jgi:hypothetical protein
MTEVGPFLIQICTLAPLFLTINGDHVQVHAEAISIHINRETWGQTRLEFLCKFIQNTKFHSQKTKTPLLVYYFSYFL